MIRVRDGGIIALVWLGLAVAPVRAGDFGYARDDRTEASVAAAGIGLFGLGYWFDRGYQPLTPAEIAALDPAELNALDRSAVNNWSPGAARASDYLAWTSALAPVVLMFDEPGRNQAGIIGVMYLETALLSEGLIYLLKTAVARTRPYVYRDDPAVSLDLKMSRTSRRSFPSGHTATAFASLVFLATVQEQLHPGGAANDWVWGGCLAAAATTGYLRYAAGKHFPTDILAGAAIGGFAGWIVPRWHELEATPRGPQEKSRPARETIIGVRLAF